MNDVRSQVDFSKLSGQMNIHYTHVPNLAVRLSSGARNFSGPALLLNCHLDTTVDGPGASDDALNCAILMQIIKVITETENFSLSNDIIFLFNGAEEDELVSAHAFITQHDWANDVNAFVNLEGTRSGGKELLFQVSPNANGLLLAYINSAPYPFGSIIGQEIYQSGLVPSTTDFSIFTRYRGIPGLDIAFIDEGYVYHTAFDTADRIPDGTIKRAGENILALTVSISSNLEILLNSETSSSVYFDVLGLFMVKYPSWIGSIVNFASILLQLFSVIFDLWCHKKGSNTSQCSKTLVLMVCFLLTCLAIVFSVATSASISQLLKSCNSVLSWYSQPSLLFLLYSIPTIGIFIFILLILPKLILRKVCSYEDPKFIKKYLIHSQSLVLSLICSVALIKRLDSAFIFSLPLFFNFLCWCVEKFLSGNHRCLSLLFFNHIQFLTLAICCYVTQLSLGLRVCGVVDSF